jgi:hypothetical protein
VNVTPAPVATLTLAGWSVTAGAIWAAATVGAGAGELTRSIAGLVSVEPCELAKTARYSRPLSTVAAVIV